MKLECVWEHNGNDTLLYVENMPGAYVRGRGLSQALDKLEREVKAWCLWAGVNVPQSFVFEIVQESSCELAVCDADSDVLFDGETKPMTEQEYQYIKRLAMKSALDFQRLYDSILDRNIPIREVRKTFYGQVPCTAEEMYLHTKNVNAYYFGEINVPADNVGTIVECRRRGFDALEAMPDYLQNPVIEGSYEERWSLKKMLRRFLWHDRIHAKAMYRKAVAVFGRDKIQNPFFFDADNEQIVTKL